MNLHQLIDNCWEFRRAWKDNIRNNPYWAFVDLKWLPDVRINDKIKYLSITQNDEIIKIQSDDVNFCWYVTINIDKYRRLHLNIWNVLTSADIDLYYSENTTKNLFDDLNRIVEKYEEDN